MVEIAAPVVGARRIGEYCESKTEATRFRRAFFLVSRVLRSLERPESCARSPARGCPLPFTTPRSESGHLCRSHSCKPFSFCSTHPTQNCTSLCSTMPCHTTLRHATPHYTAQNCVFTVVSFVLITKSSVQSQACTFMHFRFGLYPQFLFYVFLFNMSSTFISSNYGLLELFSNYYSFCFFIFSEILLVFSSPFRLLLIERTCYEICAIIIYNL